MNPNEAATALEGVDRTEKKLAEHSHWPFYRHAMFGLAEGLLIAGLAQPIAIGGSMTAASLVLVAGCVWDDRRRHGMFVSGWQPGATRPLTIMLVLVITVMAAASLLVRDGETVQPLGFLIGLVTFTVCTAASLLWQKIYRAQLERGGRQ
ncbi:MAG: hypothetical protein M3438_03275 [Pseudomonadota bacterium]|nr:hypothetical protein [Pseudomonadota bacterium]